MTEWYSEWRKGPYVTDSESSLPYTGIILDNNNNIVMYIKKESTT